MFGWLRRREQRASPSGPTYTDAVVAALVANAEGIPSDPGATAALEAAAGLISRALSMATVEGGRGVLTPAVLTLAGREMVRQGEALFRLSMSGGRVMAIPAAHWDVRGMGTRWWYRMDMPSPDITETVVESGDGVLHFRYACDAATPWKGISPLGYASATGKLIASIETALAGEAAGPFGHVLPLPDGVDDATKTTLKADLEKIRGGLRLVDSTAGGWGEGQAAKPSGDWLQRRIGADPPASVVSLRSDSALSVLAACGVPPALVIPGEGGGAREAWRRFLHGTLHPLGTIIQQEAADKLAEPDLAIRFDKLFASDLTGRARAFQSMVGAGMEAGKAAGLAGLMEAED